MSIVESVLKKQYHYASAVLVDDSIFKRITAASWEYPADESLDAVNIE